MFWTDEKLRQFRNQPIKVEDVYQFLHCKKCMEDFMDGYFGQGQSPAEAMAYHAGSVPIAREDGKTISCVAIFCKRCDSLVWDSRHLEHITPPCRSRD